VYTRRVLASPFGPTGVPVSAIGQGTWHMGELKRIRKDEVAALRLGIELGLTHIDTAEMYADGQAEEIVAEAVGRQRDRDIEKDVVPHCERERIAVVGYTPLARGGFMRGAVADVAKRLGRTPRQVALNFLTRRPSLFAIPKATRPEHVRENAGALDFTLTAQDLSAIDAERRR